MIVVFISPACSEDGDDSSHELVGDAGEGGVGNDDDVGGDSHVSVPAGGGGERSSAGGGAGGVGGDDSFAHGGATDGVEVVEVTPANEGVDIDPRTEIRVAFSRPIEAESLTPENARVLDGTTPVAGEWSCDRRECSFTPSERLSLLTRYELRLSQDVTATDGASLRAPFASSFRVRDGVWSKVGLAFGAPGVPSEVIRQTLAADGHGNFLLVWEPLKDELWARWYRVDSGWDEPVQLQQPPHSHGSISMSVSPEGDAIIGWNDSLYDDAAKSFHEEMLVKRFVGGAWGPTERIGPALDLAAPVTGRLGVRVGMSAGHALVVATLFKGDEDPGTQSVIEAEALSNEPWATSALSYPQHAATEIWMRPQGEAIILADGAYFARQPGGVWQPLEVPAATNGWQLLLGADQTFWHRCTAARVYPGILGPGDSYVDAGNDFPCSAIYVADPSTFWATWVEVQDFEQVAMHAARFDDTQGGWSAPTSVYRLPVPFESYWPGPQLGFDAHGNGLMFFLDPDPVPLEGWDQSTYSVSTLRFAKHSGVWAAAPSRVTPRAMDNVELTDEYRVDSAVVAANGIAMVVFRSGMGLAEAYPDWASGAYAVFE